MMRIAIGLTLAILMGLASGPARAQANGEIGRAHV